MKKFIVLILLIVFLVITIYAGVNFLGKEKSPIENILSNEEYKEYKAGDYVTFNESNWYVMYDSDKKSDYVTLITADLLSFEEEDIGDVLNGIYESSDLNNYLKTEYLESLGPDKLVEKNGYKVRLFNKDDFDNILGDNASYDSKKDEYTLTNCPNFICQTNSFYATMIDTNSDAEFKNVYLNVDDIEDKMYGEYELHLKYYNITSTYETFRMNSITNTTTLFVRPVINVYKKSLE